MTNLCINTVHITITDVKLSGIPTFLKQIGVQDSEFRSFFERIEETINCFRDLLTFSPFSDLHLTLNYYSIHIHQCFCLVSNY